MRVAPFIPPGEIETSPFWRSICFLMNTMRCIGLGSLFLPTTNPAQSARQRGLHTAHIAARRSDPRGEYHRYTPTPAPCVLSVHSGSGLLQCVGTCWGCKLRPKAILCTENSCPIPAPRSPDDKHTAPLRRQRYAPKGVQQVELVFLYPALGVCSSNKEGLDSWGTHGHWVQNYVQSPLVELCYPPPPLQSPPFCQAGSPLGGGGAVTM